MRRHLLRRLSRRLAGTIATASSEGAMRSRLFLSLHSLLRKESGDLASEHEASSAREVVLGFRIQNSRRDDRPRLRCIYTRRQALPVRREVKEDSPLDGEALVAEMGLRTSSGYYRSPCAFVF